MSDEPFVGRCRACAEAVPTDAKTCPECGYDVSRHDRIRLVRGLLGTALTLTVVLAPIGIPLLWSAYRHRQLAEGTVTSPAPTAFRTHVGTVSRHQLRLSSAPVSPRGDFTRGGSSDDSE